ncbi:MAG: hypothetical protein E7368_02145 [Clostridiales bacterium]|nr:hypothetical protein [Clostridiales bacterium]
MDAFYEESAINRNAEKGERTYKILHYVAWVILVFAIIFAIFTIWNIPMKPKAGAENYETAMANYSSAFSFWLMLVGITLVFIVAWVVLIRIKRRINISYDYIFVSGDLRIAKIFNINKRKLAERINCEDILQIGDVDNSSFERLVSAPDVKPVYFTPNQEPDEEKFFMYILVNSGGKKLFILECRENLLMNIMKFTRRSALESDYVMQERKKKQI